LAADPCRNLTQTECEAAGASCQPIQAFSAEVACADPLHPGAELVFAGCIALGTEEVFCAQAETWACSVEAPVTCYLFLEWCYWPTFVQADQEAICNTPDPDQDTLGDSADLDNADIS
jgi:hypothetical protein